MHRVSVLIGLVLLTLLTAPGCNQSGDNPPPADANAATPQTTEKPNNNANQSTSTGASETADKAKQAVNDLLEAEAKKEHPLFPKGTQLTGINVEGDTVALDFSPEFNKLEQMGETGESDVQKALRKSLAPITALNKMRVTVQGKPFESQATDWNTPFAIRNEGN